MKKVESHVRRVNASNKSLLKRAKIRLSRSLGRPLTYQDHPSLTLKKSFSKSMKRRGSTVRNLLAHKYRQIRKSIGQGQPNSVYRGGK